MDLNHLWVRRESEGKSVSLTLVVLSFIICNAASGLEMAGIIKNTSMCFELFSMCCGLHFGRTWISAKGAKLENKVQ